MDARELSDSGARAEIGVIGGSGFYSFLDGVERVSVDTPYGQPSAPISIATVGDRAVAFLPRHGESHEFPPHAINYRANLWALHHLGVRWVIGPCASGSLQARVAIGDFVVCDQYVDRTSGRRDTYFDGPEVAHVAAADPFSPVLRTLLVERCRAREVAVHDGGTVVVIQGPRFSTRAESRWFSQMGWEVVNMTAYPEAHLARELEMAYANIALVTDYDAGLEGVEGISTVSADEVVRVFHDNNARLRDLLLDVIPRIPSELDPHSANALVGARL